MHRVIPSMVLNIGMTSHQQLRSKVVTTKATLSPIQVRKLGIKVGHKKLQLERTCKSPLEHSLTQMLIANFWNTQLDQLITGLSLFQETLWHTKLTSVNHVLWDSI
jgi:hypothetical protein